MNTRGNPNHERAWISSEPEREKIDDEHPNKKKRITNITEKKGRVLESFTKSRPPKKKQKTDKEPENRTQSQTTNQKNLKGLRNCRAAAPMGRSALFGDTPETVVLTQFEGSEDPPTTATAPSRASILSQSEGLDWLAGSH